MCLRGTHSTSEVRARALVETAYQFDWRKDIGQREVWMEMLVKLRMVKEPRYHLQEAMYSLYKEPLIRQTLEA